MAPGVAPPYRAAAAWPNSWKPADTMVKAKTISSSPGWSKAWSVAEARPFSSRTQAHTATNASRTVATTNGLNKRANGAVIRRVTDGSETTYRNVSASSGFDLLTSGCDPSASCRTPSVRNLESHSV